MSEKNVMSQEEKEEYVATMYPGKTIEEAEAIMKAEDKAMAEQAAEKRAKYPELTDEEYKAMTEKESAEQLKEDFKDEDETPSDKNN